MSNAQSNNEWARLVQDKVQELNGLLIEAPARDVMVKLKAIKQDAYTNNGAFHAPLTITLSERLRS